MNILKNRIYKHRKGNLYRVLNIGYNSETEEPMVIYESLKDSKIWIRPEKEFQDGRFQRYL